MDTDTLTREMNLLVSLEECSLVRHTEKARPHLTPKTYPIWAKMHEWAEHSRHREEMLTDIIARLELRERRIPCSSDLGFLAYIDMGTLVRELHAQKAQQVRSFEKVVELTAERSRIHDQLQDMLDEVKEQLETLDQYVEELPPPSAKVDTPPAPGELPRYS